MLSQLIFAVVLVAPSVAFRKPENYYTVLQERYRLGLATAPKPSGNVSTLYMQQPMDHFDRYNNQTYTQTYYVNDQFLDVSRPTGFIFLGGEWVESASTLEYGTNIMSSWAKTFGGIMVDIQHRYYDGQNPPTIDGMSRYLNSEQALADAARIVEYVNEQYSSKLKQPIKWVVTSGSYGGIMAATFRLRYPHLAIGAVAVSAPVTATLDYTGYYAVLGRNINDTDPECLQTIRAAVRELDGYLDDPTKGWAKVNADFQTNIASTLDAAYWGVGVGGTLQAGLCKPTGATPYEKLVNTDYIDRNATFNAAQLMQGYGPQWSEQLCSEWSFFQTGTDFDTNPMQIMSRHVTAELLQAACSYYGLAFLQRKMLDCRAKQKKCATQK